jgi:hypothetical protein
VTPLEAERIVAGLKAAHPTRRIPKESLELYARQLTKLTYESARDAVEHLILTSPHWPQLQEIFAETKARRPQREDREELPPPMSPELAAEIKAYTATLGRGIGREMP